MQMSLFRFIQLLQGNIQKTILKKRIFSYIIDKSWVNRMFERIKMIRHAKYLTTILILTICMIFGLTGCGEEVVIPVTEPTVEVTADGDLIAYLVEDFDKDYYNLAELDAMVRDEVAAFVKENALSSEAGKEGMNVVSVEMAQDGSKKVVVALKFDTCDAYEDYFGTETFYGTVADAQKSGYGLSAALTSVKDGEIFTEELAKKYGKKHILVIEDAVMVRCPSEVLYVGTNASMTKEGFVDCTQSEGLKLIIMK